jgi:hypothetical protein
MPSTSLTIGRERKIGEMAGWRAFSKKKNWSNGVVE